MQRQKCKLNVEAFLQLIVELSYFMYSCKNNQATPYIDFTRDIRVEEMSLRNMEKRFSVVVWYKVSESGLQEGEAMTNLMALIEYIFKEVNEHLGNLKD